MRWHLATNKQLDIIFNSDNSCPNHLLVGVVEEMLVRKMFDPIIIMVAEKTMAKYERDEVLQTGYMAVYQLAKIYKDKLSFKKMCFIAIERRLKNILQKKYQKRNFFNSNAESIQELAADSHFDIADSHNVEKQVIRQLTYESQMERLSDKEKHIVDLFLKGYSIAYIANHFYKQDPKAIHYHFKKALKKMDIKDFKIGARCGLKGA